MPNLLCLNNGKYQINFPKGSLLNKLGTCQDSLASHKNKKITRMVFKITKQSALINKITLQVSRKFQLHKANRNMMRMIF